MGINLVSLDRAGKQEKRKIDGRQGEKKEEKAETKDKEINKQQVTQRFLHLNTSISIGQDLVLSAPGKDYAGTGN